MPSKSRVDLKSAYADIFSTEEERTERREEAQLERVREVSVSDITEFPDHPFKVLEDEEMEHIKESIRTYGVLTPAIARQKGDGYELISGHRRLAACKALGVETLPVIVRNMTDDEAVIFMVDANLQREHIRPSEKAFAYKMKMEALSHQGKATLSQVATKSDTASEIGKKSGESRDQVFRFIRLTNLIPELLQMVDDRRIAFNPAVELSYLPKEQQTALLAIMQEQDCTPSHAQAIQFKKAAQENALTAEMMTAMLSEPKPNQQEHIKVPTDRIDKYLRKNATAKDREAFLDKAIDYYGKLLLRKRDEPER